MERSEDTPAKCTGFVFSILLIRCCWSAWGYRSPQARNNLCSFACERSAQGETVVETWSARISSGLIADLYRERLYQIEYHRLSRRSQCGDGVDLIRSQTKRIGFARPGPNDHRKVFKGSYRSNRNAGRGGPKAHRSEQGQLYFHFWSDTAARHPVQCTC